MPARRTNRDLAAVAASALLTLMALLLAAAAGAQIPRDLPDPPPDRTANDPAAGLPQLPAGMMPGQGQPATVMPTAPVVPDTARIGIRAQADSPQPARIFIVPDTVLFGDVAALVCAFPAGSPAPRFADFGEDAELAPLLEELSGAQLDRFEQLAAADGDRGHSSILIPFRSYRADPFVVTWGDAESQVVSVRGRTDDLSQAAPVRAPRVWGWNLWTVAGLALVSVLLVLLAWRLWTLRRSHTALEDWEPAAPAWIEAADRLLQLLDSAAIEQGRGRDFLNGLASVARGFAADRYGIAAREMTGGEIIAACGRLGYRPTVPARLGRLIDEADRRRYDPAPVDEAWCRERAAELIAQMDDVRILPRQTKVAAEIRLQADQAWMKLERFLPEGAATGHSTGLPTRGGA